jgi:hypothetical protein
MMDVVAGWIVEAHDEHTCAGGTADVGYAHEPSCGLEPIEEIRPLRARVQRLYSMGERPTWFWEIRNPVAGEVREFDFGYADTHGEAVVAANRSVRLLTRLFDAYAALAVS